MSTQWHGGKGSSRRPENKEQFEENWDKIFGRKVYKNDEKEYEHDWPEPDLTSFGEIDQLEKVRSEHPIRGNKV